MTYMNISQLNQVSHEYQLEDLDRHANEQSDIRIEGHGVSIRLPFLPTLQHLLYQSKENTDFFVERIKANKKLGVEAIDFDSPIAIFNFLLPSYLLKFNDVSIVESEINLSGYDSSINATPDCPAFAFKYWTSKYEMNMQRIMVRMVMNANQCYVQLLSGTEGAELANSLVKIKVVEGIINDRLP